MMRTVRFLVLAIGIVASAMAARRAAAAPPAADATPHSSLALRLDLADMWLDPESVRRAIATELGVSVTLVGPEDTGPGLSLSVDASRRARATMHADGSEPVERVIDLPKDRARAIESIAWLAGNLARDEAADLLATLKHTDEAASSSATEGASTGASATESPSATAAAPEAKPNAEPPHSSAARPPTNAAPERREAPGLNLTFAYPITLLPKTEKRTLRLELGLIYSRVGAVSGAALNLGAIRVEGPIRGVALALGLVDASAVDGVAAAVGVTSIGRVQGVGASVGVTFADDVEGVETSTVVNVARRKVSGVQAGAVVNVTRELDGVQFGVVNVATKARGVQIGIVNVTDEMDGVPIGLVNIDKHTRVSALAWANDVEAANVSVKITTGYVYTELGVGYRMESRRDALEAGLGAHFGFDRVFLEPGVHYVNEIDDSTGGFRDLVYRATVGVRLVEPLALFAGGGLRQELEADAVHPTYFGGISLF